MKKILIFMFVLCMLVGCNLPVDGVAEEDIDAPVVSVANMVEVVNGQVTVNTPECSEQAFVVGENEPWVAVSLGEQAMSFYSGEKLIDQFVISSGGSLNPTPAGSYRVYKKYDQYQISENNIGVVDGIWVLFFHHEYSVYGGDWNDNLGLPVTRGNINMSIEDIKLIYEQFEEGSHVYIYN